jgi:hypothetical protein
MKAAERHLLDPVIEVLTDLAGRPEDVPDEGEEAMELSRLIFEDAVFNGELFGRLCYFLDDWLDRVHADDDVGDAQVEIVAGIDRTALRDLICNERRRIAPPGDLSRPSGLAGPSLKATDCRVDDNGDDMGNERDAIFFT